MTKFTEKGLKKAAEERKWRIAQGKILRKALEMYLAEVMHGMVDYQELKYFSGENDILADAYHIVCSAEMYAHAKHLKHSKS